MNVSSIQMPKDAIEIISGYSAPGYGLPSQETIEAIKMAVKLEAIITDPVYEGKSMAGLIDLCQKRTFKSGSRVLYVHLGGAPAINAYYQAFDETVNLAEIAKPARYTQTYS